MTWVYEKITYHLYVKKDDGTYEMVYGELDVPLYRRVQRWP